MYLKAEIEAGAGTRVEAPLLCVGAEAPLSRLASLSSSLSLAEPKDRLFGHESLVLQMKTRFVE